jgi:hypothetical protein
MRWRHGGEGINGKVEKKEVEIEGEGQVGRMR